MRILTCLMVLTFMLTIPTHAASGVKDGTLNLSDTPLVENGPVDLDGEWDFYWRAFHQPNALDSQESSLIQTPGTWGSQPLDIDNHGYGTYHLSIVLSEQDVGTTLGFYLPSIASAYDLFLNGKKLASSGEVGTAGKGETEPSESPHPLYFTVDQEVVDVVLHVSNFSQRKGGIWDNIRIGTADQITSEYQKNLLFQGFIATGLLLMAIYHLGLFYFRQAKSTLFFGLTSLLLFLRMVFVGEIIAVQLIPSIPWELAVKVEYLSVFYGISFFVLYFHHLYEGIFRRVISHTLALLMMGITLPILVLPAKIYTEWMLPYQLVALVLVLYILYGLVRAAIDRRTGARINLLAGSVFVVTVLNDILYYNYVMESIDLVTLGLFLFIFTQMFMLAKKFSASFQKVEVLSDELKVINENLENIVHQRTEKLRQSNEQLKEVQQARKEFLSNITHELGNPLTTIIGYLRVLKDGRYSEQKERHITIAYQKSLKLKRMTDDLRKLAVLDHHRLSFEMETIELDKLSTDLKNVYNWDLMDRDVKLTFDLPTDQKPFVHVDMDRVEQVFTNIVNNALAHTEQGDQLVITGRYFSFAQAYVVSVQDTGVGITEENQKHLFKRFYRVDNHIKKEQHTGTGLGLAISKSIMETHKGKIGVRSTYGEGSTFYFILPVVREESV